MKILGDHTCLFSDFGEDATIHRTGETLVVVHESTEGVVDLSLSRYKNISATATIHILDKNKAKKNDILTLTGSGASYRVDHLEMAAGGVVRLILSTVQSNEYINF
jgi:hypothetical protein